MGMRMAGGWLPVLAVAAAVLAVPESLAGEAALVVEVTGVRTADGVIRIALYDGPGLFLKQDVAKRIVPAVAGTTVVRLDGLAPGTYAIAAYHDENGNGKFDKTMIGLPLEGYAFSNEARPFLGPPAFETAAFPLALPETTARFTVVYP